jgi:hypothetical protein
VGRNLQVKDLRFCFVQLPTFGGPHVLAFDQRPGRTMRESSPPSKASSTLCHRSGTTKSLESLRDGSTSTEDLRSLIFPRRKIRSRKSECLGRAVSLSPRRSELLRRPTGPLVTPCSGLPVVTLHRECRAFLDLLLCLTLKRQAEDKWLDHARPTGFPWGETGPQRPETTSTYQCSSRTDVPRTS